MFKNILHYKDVFRLLSGHIIAQIITIFFSPFLTRIYSPSDYALLGIMLASTNILFEVYTLKYERSIVTTSNKIVAANILIFCILIAFFIAALLMMLSSFTEFYYLKKIHSQIGLLIILPIITFFMAVVNSIYFWFQRISKFTYIATNKIFQMTMINTMSWLLGYFKFKDGLIWGYFSGWMLTFVYTLIQLYHTNFKLEYFSIKIIKDALLKYKYYPMFNMLPSFLQVIAQAAPFFLVTYYYGKVSGGHFNLCKQIIQIPFSFVTVAISQVYLKKITDSINYHQKISTLLMSIFKFLFVLIVFALLIIFIGREHLFVFIFGDDWGPVGMLSKYYIFSVIVFSIHQSFSIIYPSLNLISYESIIKFLYFSTIFVILFFHPKNFISFMVLYTISECIVYGIGIFIILRNVQKYDKSIDSETSK